MLAMAERYDVRRSAPVAHAIDLLLPSGNRVVGSVNGCIDGVRPGPARIAFHRGRPRDEIWLALELLVLTVNDPDTSWRGVAVSRPNRGSVEPVTVVGEVLGVDATERMTNAVGALEVLVEQYRDGQCYPLPLFEKTSYQHHCGGNARTVWDPGFGAAFPRESEDPYHVMAFGSLGYHELTRIAPGGYTLDCEAERLWGTVGRAIADLHDDDEGAER